MKVNNASQRKMEFLAQIIAGEISNTDSGLGFIQECTKLKFGQVNECKNIISSFTGVYYHYDCSDFRLNFYTRMLLDSDISKNTPGNVKQEIKELLLNHAYWLSTNKTYFGKQNMWTENHVLAYHTAAFLTGKLFPEETLKDSCVTGKEMMEIVKPKILDWINMKLCVGISEWDSNTYMAVNICSLLNLFDLSEDRDIKEQAGKMLTVIFFGMAVGSFYGSYCGTQGRTYTKSLKYVNTESTSSVQYLAFSLGNPKELKPHKCSLFYSLSKYEIPEIIYNIAHDYSDILIDKQQQSFNVEDGPLLGKGFEEEEDLTFYWHNMGYTHKNIINNMRKLEDKYGICVHQGVHDELRYYKQCEEQGITGKKCRCITYMSRINKYTYRTKDYMISCAQDFRKGEYGFQQHIWQATLKGNAKVFVNHPGTLVEHQGRPDYWAGNGIMPRTIQDKNTLFCQFKLKSNNAILFTHAFFPVNEFDEVVEFDDWIIGRKEKGFVALFSLNGYCWNDSVEKTDAICKGAENIWICQMSSSNEQNFTSFINKLNNMEITFENEKLYYTSPSGDEYEFCWSEDLVCNGQIIKVKDYLRFDNKYTKVDYMSGKYKIEFNGDVLEIG